MLCVECGDDAERLNAANVCAKCESNEAARRARGIGGVLSELESGAAALLRCRNPAEFDKQYIVEQRTETTVDTQITYTLTPRTANGGGEYVASRPKAVRTTRTVDVYYRRINNTTK